jgi:hypothetical protein
MNPDDLNELIRKWQQAERNYADNKWEKKQLAQEMWEEIDKLITLPKAMPNKAKPLAPAVQKVVAKPIPKRPFGPKVVAFDNYTALEGYTFWKPLADIDDLRTTVIKAGSQVSPLYVREWTSDGDHIYTSFCGKAQVIQQNYPVYLKHCYSGEPDNTQYTLVKFPTPTHDGTHLAIGFYISNTLFNAP